MDSVTETSQEVIRNKKEEQVTILNEVLRNCVMAVLLFHEHNVIYKIYIER